MTAKKRNRRILKILWTSKYIPAFWFSLKTTQNKDFKSEDVEDIHY